jgi:hypothetical protein
MTLVYYYNDCVSGHYPSSCFYLRHTTFRRLDSAAAAAGVRRSGLALTTGLNSVDST